MEISHPTEQLIRELRAKGIHDEAVLKAFRQVPRHVFVEPEYESFAYEDRALPISCEQTISQPYIVARMTESVLADRSINKILEIGTGSGYQAAILSQLVSEVYSIERIKPLLDTAQARFKELDLTNIDTLYGDGSLGWPEHAPFDAILVTAAAQSVPQALLDQLADGGRMVIPAGQTHGDQSLELITRTGDQYSKSYLDPVLFVPLKKGTEDA